MLTIHAATTVLPIVAEPIADGAVAVEGDRIMAVGFRGDVLAAAPGARVRTWRGVLTAGLVNAHTHLQYTDFADLATVGPPFFEWIRTLSARRRSFTDAMWAAPHDAACTCCCVRARRALPTSSPTGRRWHRPHDRVSAGSATWRRAGSTRRDGSTPTGPR